MITGTSTTGAPKAATGGYSACLEEGRPERRTRQHHTHLKKPRRSSRTHVAPQKTSRATTRLVPEDVPVHAVAEQVPPLRDGSCHDPRADNKNNGKPWTSSRILRVKPNFFIFLSFLIILLIFPFFHFFHFFIFRHFSFFHCFFFSSSSVFFFPFFIF